MNLAESMRFILKTKGQSILSSLVKEVTAEFLKITQVSHRAIQSFSLKDTAMLIKVIPQRVNNGLKLFSAEFIFELEKLPDPMERTKFCMKVLAGLSKFALSSAYDVKMLSLGRGKTVNSRLILSRIIFKTIQSFVIRLVEEIEKEVTSPEELKYLRGFKKTVLDDSGNAIDKFFEGVTDPGDRAFVIVESLKKYILTGS